MADSNAPSMSEVLGAYRSGLVQQNMPEPVVDEIIIDAAKALHRGDLSIVAQDNGGFTVAPR